MAANREAKNSKSPKKQMSMWSVIMIVIIAVYVLSFFIPAGEFQRDGKYAIPGTYAQIDKIYLNPLIVLREITTQAHTTFGKLFVTILIFWGHDSGAGVHDPQCNHARDSQ